MNDVLIAISVLGGGFTVLSLAMATWHTVRFHCHRSHHTHTRPDSRHHN